MPKLPETPLLPILPVLLCLLLTLTGLFGCQGDDPAAVAPGVPGPQDGDAHVYGSCEPNTAPFPVRPAPSEPATLPFLKVRGMQILDEDDRPVALRGTNFGSWLMMENWIAGIGRETVDDFLVRFNARAAELGLETILREAQLQLPSIVHYLVRDIPVWTQYKAWIAYVEEHAGTPEERENARELAVWFDGQPWIFEERTLWLYFIRRFGWAGMERLRTAFQENFITELDVERAAQIGFNLIRVPVWYEALETDYAGEANRFKPEGWARLDRVVNWARRHGVYVMIDLHGAPGGQSGYWHMGLPDGGDLWDRPECIAKTARLWAAVADYFKDEPHVAVLDLLNEPNTVPSQEKYIEVFDAIYREIRRYDDRHIIGLSDGFAPAERVAAPQDMGWEEDCCILQGHYYPGYAFVPTRSAEEYRDSIEADLLNYSRRFGVGERFRMPLFAGEFNAAVGGEGEAWTAEGMRLALEMFNRRGIHGAPWTWKYYRPGSAWGAYHPTEPLHPEIPCTDSPIYPAIIGPTAIIGQDDCYQIDVTAGFEEILRDLERLNSRQYSPGYPAYLEALRDGAMGAFSPVPDLTP